MNERQRAYLEELSSIETPSQIPLEIREKRDEECWLYC